MPEVIFPSSFLWGAAISSYQCEGGIQRADWTLWERKKSLTQADRACDHYVRFPQDIELLSNLHLNAFRFSLEWSRICPQEGVFDDEAIDHYRQVFAALKAKQITPLVTLHHFTNPVWFAEKGGWACRENIDFFLAYLQKVVTAFRDEVTHWIIFNEPLVYLYLGFIAGVWPPGVQSMKTAHTVFEHMIDAYSRGYEEIKRIYQGKAQEPQVSLTKHMRIFAPAPGIKFPLNGISAFLRHRVFNIAMIDSLSKKGYLDFLALNYYCREFVRFKGLLGKEVKLPHSSCRRNEMGWYVDPRGLYRILMKLKSYNLPIIITENGTDEAKDYLYREYLTDHLSAMTQALAGGVDIRGYFWWSLLDNFEWNHGFRPRFGLYDVDYETMQRNIKPYAAVYATIARENRMDIND